MKAPPSLVSLLKTKRLPCVHNNSNKTYFKRTTVNPDKSMAMYNKLQIISVTGKENKIIATRLRDWSKSIGGGPEQRGGGS